MKRYCTLITIVCSLLLQHCASLPKADAAQISSPAAVQKTGSDNWLVDTAATVVRFTGHGTGKNHPGRFQLSDGFVTVANNEISGGRFTINIASLIIEQPQAIYQNKLKPHLLSADFFDTAHYPTVLFEITNVQPITAGKQSVVTGDNHLVSGNLTLKGITRNLSFPATISISNNNLQATANFNIDRTQWGMHYGNDHSLGDHFISETVNVQLQFIAHQ